MAEVTAAAPQIYSMTGYACLDWQPGSASSDGSPAGRACRLHLKSVNHRFFELRWRTPRTWNSLEVWFRGLCTQRVKRGSVDFWVEYSTAATKENSPQDRIDSFFSKLDEAAKQGQKKFFGMHIPNPMKLLILSRHVDLWWSAEREEGPVNETEAKEMMERLVTELQRTRLEEGQSLGRVLLEHIARLEGLHAEILAVLPSMRSKLEEDYRGRMQKIGIELGQGSSVSQDRLLQELLVLAEKRDVAEECDRISIHLKKFREILAGDGEQPGKRLDFLSQELHREWTTLGNKLQNASCSQLVIEAKLSIEKIREQSLNLA